MSRNDERLSLGSPVDTNYPPLTPEEDPITADLMRQMQVAATGQDPAVLTPRPITADPNDPVFRFVNPIAVVELPSKGLFYPESHPLYQQTTISIKHPKTEQENILGNKKLAQSGEQLDTLIASILVNRSIDPKTLLLGDRLAILIEYRILARGAAYSPKMRCPGCLGTFDLNPPCDLAEIVPSFPDEEFLKGFDIRQESYNTFSFPLPVMMFRVHVRLLTGKDEKSVYEKKGKKDEGDKDVEMLLRNTIVQVDKYTDQLHIDFTVRNMPSEDVVYFQKLYNRLFPSQTLKATITCPHCHYTHENYPVPLTQDFFYPS